MADNETGIADARRSFAAALGELEAAVASLRDRSSSRPDDQARQTELADLKGRLAEAEASRDAARRELEKLRAARAEDAAMIEDALAELQAVV